MARVHPRFTQGTGGASVEVGAAGAEAVVAEVQNVNTTPENPSVQLDVNVPFTTVAESTEVIIQVRRNSLAGPVVAKLTLKPGASAIGEGSLQVQDEPGELVKGVYVVTLSDVAKKQSKANGATIQAAY